MIIFKELTFENCFSYGPGPNTVYFNSSPVVQLVGTNGMGKSSIPLILEEALFNKNSKGIKKVDIPNRYGDGTYNIVVFFEVDGKNYTVEITRTKSVKVKLYEVGSEYDSSEPPKDLSSHTATATFKTIQELLGTDFKTFSQLVYQSTNSSLQFLTTTDTNRKKFLVDLFQLQNYTEIFEAAREAAKDINLEFSKLTGKIETINQWLDRNDLGDAIVLPELELPNGPDEEEKSLGSLQENFKNSQTYNKKVSDNNKIRELLSGIDVTELQKVDTTLEDTSGLTDELARVNAEIKIWERAANEHKDLPDECPTCGSPIDNSKSQDILESAAREIDGFEQVRDSVQAELKQKRANNTKKKAIVKEISEWEDLMSRFDEDLPESTINAADIQREIKELQDTIAKRKAEITKIIAKNKEIASNNSKIELLQEQTEQYRTELEEAQGAASDLEKKVANLEILKKAFSTNGLVAYKIENLVKDLEDLANEYLAELSDGRFTLEFVINNDKLNVCLTDNANPIEITALSSGELARVNTATLLAIRKLMSSISKSRINLLFLDEVISVLDIEGKERLIEVLLKQPELNTFVVSHGWTHPLVDKIEVVKENNISRLE